jgi:hypothetical protein
VSCALRFGRAMRERPPIRAQPVVPTPGADTEPPRGTEDKAGTPILRS